jgi:hypothetical protein
LYVRLLTRKQTSCSLHTSSNQPGVNDMSKYVNDVRSLSANAAYQGVEFGGVDTIDQAIEQARQAPEHGLAEQFVPKGMNRNRAALLQHLNLLLDYKVAEEDDALLDALFDGLVAAADVTEQVSKYSIAYAEGRGWLNGPAKLAMELDPRN